MLMSVLFWDNKALSSYDSIEVVLLGPKSTLSSKTVGHMLDTFIYFSFCCEIVDSSSMCKICLAALARLWPQQHYFYINIAGQYFIGPKCL